MNTQEYDCRAEVFRERGHEVLGSVVQGTQLSKADPFDVPELHAHARAAFDRALSDVRAGPASRILLVKGEAGCGKTHLIRALRWRTHEARGGVFAYVHMTSEHGDYRQYLLRQVVRSLSDPYVERQGEARQTSGLDVISDALVEGCGLEPGAGDKLRETEDDATLAQLVDAYADELSEAEDDAGGHRFEGVDLNTLRVLLYRQSGRKPIQRRVGSFLNGEPLADLDWAKLAALPRDCPRQPMYLLGQLARVTAAAVGVPLIVCVDQIEASDLTGQNHTPFLNAMSTACELSENVPQLLMVLSCLDSAYDAHAPGLISGYRHRIEEGPASVRLSADRTASEIRQILSVRLRWLYESEKLKHVPPDSVYPLPEDAPNRLRGQQLRVILQLVNRYREQFAVAPPHTIPPFSVDFLPPPDDAPDPAEVDRLRIAWNEFNTRDEHRVGDDDDVQFELLTWAMGEVRHELPAEATVAAKPAEAAAYCLAVAIDLPRTPAIRRVVGLCDKGAQRGGLMNQLAALEAARAGATKAAGEPHTVVVLRSTGFPKTGITIKHIEKMRQDGHAAVVVEDPVWRAMQAMRSFLKSEANRFSPEAVREWRRTDGPLVNLAGISAIVQPPPHGGGDGGDGPTGGAPAPLRPPVVAKPKKPAAQEPTLFPPAHAPAKAAPVAAPAPAVAAPNPTASPVPVAAPTPAAPAPAVPPTVGQPSAPPPAGPPPVELLDEATTSDRPIPTGPLVIGRTDGFRPADVTLDPQTLTRHTAVLGANGSGKTVLALTIVEQLLERGIGVVLFDRKGDLATYAVDSAWLDDTGAPEEHGRRHALKGRLDVDLFTPGSPAGRPLVLPLLPSGLKGLADADREEQARQSALVLAAVCSPSAAKADLFATVLTRAIELLSSADAPPRLDDLQHLLLNPPQELLAALPAHTERHCEEVG
ncbi:MAG TPA: helicase HerA-like domain-containing protein, partial [Humisphaera sp.]